MAIEPQAPPGGLRRHVIHGLALPERPPKLMDCRKTVGPLYVTNNVGTNLKSIKQEIFALDIVYFDRYGRR